METSPPQPPLTIIVVDDNPVDVYLIRWVLTVHELPYELQSSAMERCGKIHC